MLSELHVLGNSKSIVRISVFKRLHSCKRSSCSFRPLKSCFQKRPFKQYSLNLPKLCFGLIVERLSMCYWMCSISALQIPGVPLQIWAPRQVSNRPGGGDLSLSHCLLLSLLIGDPKIKFLWHSSCFLCKILPFWDIWVKINRLAPRCRKFMRPLSYLPALHSLFHLLWELKLPSPFPNWFKTHIGG